jgi:hypothetical protein
MSRYRTKTPDIVDSVKEIEKRTSRMERNPQLISASIDSGGLTVLEGAIDIIDADDDIRIKIGKLDDGNYDVTAYSEDGLTTVNLAALAFGQRAKYETGNSTNTGGTSSTYKDPDTGPDGPTVTGVLVGSSGRCKVTISAQMQCTTIAGVGGKLAMSFDVIGPTNISADNAMALVYFWGASTTALIVFRASYVHYLEALIPGTYSFKAKYFDQSTLTTNFADRLILAEPL